jgi:methyl-accepting chemotaxis protein
MDKVTQSNAANAEESASASEELSAQAETMQQVVGQLIALVGGAGSQTTAATSSRSLSRTDSTFHQIAQPVAKAAAANTESAFESFNM